MCCSRPFKALLVALTLAGVNAVGARASACGASAGGIAGIAGCSLAEHNEAVRKKWHVGASASYTSTAIRFDDDLRFDQERNVVLATLGYAPKRDIALEFGAGSLVDGSFERAGAVYDFSPGSCSSQAARIACSSTTASDRSCSSEANSLTCFRARNDT